MEALEQRTLLSLTPPLEGLPPDLPPLPPELPDFLMGGELGTGDVVPGKLGLGVWSETKIDDIGEYLASQDWPAVFGDVTAAQFRWMFTIPKEGGFLSTVQMSLPYGMPVSEALRELEGVSFLEFAAPDRASGVDQFRPDDTCYSLQYHHPLMQNDYAWETTMGEGVVIAVVDSGIGWDHEDLPANIWTNPGEVPWDGIDADNNWKVDDVLDIGRSFR